MALLSVVFLCVVTKCSVLCLSAQSPLSGSPAPLPWVASAAIPGALNHKRDIMFMSTRLLSSDLNNMVHHPLSHTIHAHMDIAGYGYTPTAKV